MIQLDYLKMNTALWKDIKTEHLVIEYMGGITSYARYSNRSSKNRTYFSWKYMDFEVSMAGCY